MLSQTSCDFTNKTGSPLSKYRLGVCVRSVEGQLKREDIKTMEKQRLLLGAGAIIMVLPTGASLSGSGSVSIGISVT